jgi:hypothetical protein
MMCNMPPKWEIAGDYSVEVWFRITKDSEGFPKSRNWEQLLALPLLKREDYFQIESVPFFLKNVSRGDIIQARESKDVEPDGRSVFEFEKVIDRQGHNTYCLFLKRKHSDDPDYTIDELISKGLAVEQEGMDLLAVDVPPTVDQSAIDKYLVAECEAGRWEMQDGCLQIETER